MRNTVLAAAAAAALFSAPASATILVDQASPYGGYSVGGTDWTKFTQALGAQPGGYSVGSIGNSADVAAASAIIVVLRDNNFGSNFSLSATEIANLTSFAATGGRILLIGEGNFWNNWGNALLGFASNGAATEGTVYSGTATAVVSNDLTAGVGSVLLQGAGTTTGGTALFTQNFATLWGDNVLTVLDANIFQDYPAPVFRDNVAAWLGASTVAPVPEPATWAMAMAGFAVIGSMMRRRPIVARVLA
jgi:hypothetical protein